MSFILASQNLTLRRFPASGNDKTGKAEIPRLSLGISRIRTSKKLVLLAILFYGLYLIFGICLVKLICTLEPGISYFELLAETGQTQLQYPYPCIETAVRTVKVIHKRPFLPVLK